MVSAFVEACGSSEAPSRPDANAALGGSAGRIGTTESGAGGKASAEHGASGSDTGGKASASGGDGGAAPGFWTRVSQVSASGNDPKRFFLVDKDWWLVRFGVPELADAQASFDAGATWQRFRTAFRGPSLADSTFWLLGTGLDGAPIARWTYPDPCSECETANAPGSPGQTLLIRYERASGSWQKVDVMPPGAEDVRDVARSAASPEAVLWLFGPKSVLRFAGLGAWTHVEPPAGATPIASLAIEADGTPLLTGNELLFEGTPTGGGWQPVTLPETEPVINQKIQARNIGTAREGQRYLYAVSPFDGSVLFASKKTDGSWTNITPSTPSATYAGDWVFATSRTGTLIVANFFRASSDSAQLPMMTWLSSDNGLTWLEQRAGLPKYFPQDLVFGPDERAYLCARSADTVIWTSPAPAR